MAQRLKSLHAMRESWVRSLGREDPLKKEIATHSSILAWRIPRTAEPGGLQSMGSQRVGQNYMTNTHCPSLHPFSSGTNTLEFNIGNLVGKGKKFKEAIYLCTLNLREEYKL